MILDSMLIHGNYNPCFFKLCANRYIIQGEVCDFVHPRLSASVVGLLPEKC